MTSNKERLEQANIAEALSRTSSSCDYIVSWTKSGTCEWSVDEHGNFVIRPADGAQTGVITDWPGPPEFFNGFPWNDYEVCKTIKTARFESGCSTPICTHLFRGCTNLVSVDISGLDTSSVTNPNWFGNTFGNCINLCSLTLLGGTFASAVGASRSFIGIPNAAWKDSLGETYATTSDMLSANAKRDAMPVTYTVNVTEGWCSCGPSCECQIDETGQLTVRPTPGFKTGTIRSDPWAESKESIKTVVIEQGVVAQGCAHLFYDCENLTSVDLNSLDTSATAGMQGMFQGCTSLTSVDLSGLDLSSVDDAKEMFCWCEKLVSVKFPKTGMPKLKEADHMFKECESLKSIDLSMLDAKQVNSMVGMFNSCISLEEVNLQGFNNDFPERATEQMFEYCSVLDRITLPVGAKLLNTGLHNVSWTDSDGNVFESTRKMLRANANTVSERDFMTYTASPISRLFIEALDKKQNDDEHTEDASSVYAPPDVMPTKWL